MNGKPTRIIRRRTQKNAMGRWNCGAKTRDCGRGEGEGSREMERVSRHQIERERRVCVLQADVAGSGEGGGPSIIRGGAPVDFSRYFYNCHIC